MNDLSGVGIFHFKIHLISAFCKRAYIEFNLKLRLIAAGDRAVVDLGFHPSGLACFLVREDQSSIKLPVCRGKTDVFNRKIQRGLVAHKGMEIQAG